MNNYMFKKYVEVASLSVLLRQFSRGCSVNNDLPNRQHSDKHHPPTPTLLLPPHTLPTSHPSQEIFHPMSFYN